MRRQKTLLSTRFRCCRSQKKRLFTALSSLATANTLLFTRFRGSRGHKKLLFTALSCSGTTRTLLFTRFRGRREQKRMLFTTLSCLGTAKTLLFTRFRARREFKKVIYNTFLPSDSKNAVIYKVSWSSGAEKKLLLTSLFLPWDGFLQGFVVVGSKK